jgi:uncharacterized protein (TIGR02001 family)
METAMRRIMISATTLSLFAGSALASGAPGQLRKEAGSVSPQSMAASYGASSSDYSPASSPFGDREFNFKATASFTSEYVFRGQQQAKHSAQGGVEISTGGLYAGAWAILPTEDNFNAYQTEIDVYGGYGFDLTERVYADVGVTGYLYNSPQLLFAKKDSVEVYAGLALDVFLKPSLYGFYDFETKDKTVETSLEYSLPFGRTDFLLGATGGYTSGRGYDYLYLQTDAEIVYNINRQASVGVGGHWAISEDHRFLNGLTFTGNDSTWYGITLKARN